MPRPLMTPMRTGMTEWWSRWLLLSLCAAGVATVVDAVLLQRARAYFTGGFLAADSLETTGQAIAFVMGSLLADLGVAGVATALVMWFSGRVGLAKSTAAAVALLVAVMPMAIADFVEYQLASYLGDAFDLQLMFDMTGRSVSEILAVSSSHLVSFATGAVLLIAAGGLLFRWFGQHRGTRRPLQGQPSFLRATGKPTMVLIIAIACTTAMRCSSDVLDNGIRRKPSGQWLGMLVNRLSDVDADGFGILGRPPDTDLWDARVRPYALDLPGNGIDEDGVAGDLPAAEPRYREDPWSSAAWARSTDVVLVVLESFRADAIGRQVNGRAVTPVIDGLARRGISVAGAYSHNGYTVQARRHIFTGSVADLRQGTLIDDFKRNGYETAYFSGQDESFGGPAYGVGFERADVSYDARADLDRRYSTFSTPGSLAVPSSVVIERITEFLERRVPSKPLFLYVNFHDTHFPYHHTGIEPLLSDSPLPQSAISASQSTALRATYLNTAANVDRAIGRVLDRVRGHLGREPGVIVIGDHGESLYDEGFLGHGYALNDAQTRIPLVVAGLPVALVEPVGQADLRDAINTAMTQGAIGALPLTKRDTSRAVFQYLGTLERPAQIKLTGLNTQISYDFRSGRVRVGADSWVVPETLPSPETTRWRALVAMWERMMLAKAVRHDRPS